MPRHQALKLKQGMPFPQPTPPARTGLGPGCTAGPEPGQPAGKRREEIGEEDRGGIGEVGASIAQQLYQLSWLGEETGWAVALEEVEEEVEEHIFSSWPLCLRRPWSRVPCSAAAVMVSPSCKFWSPETSPGCG